MTDRYDALVVTLDRDIREDDAQTLMAAIRQLRGVADVAGHVSDIATHVAETRVRNELSGKLLAVLHPSDGGRG